MQYRKHLIFLLAGLFHSTTSSGAGFALIEQNASGMGNAFAGAAAVAEDASTIYFNPAGMSYLPGSQLVVAGHLLKGSGDFSNEGSVAGAGKPLNGDGGDFGVLALLPNFYLSHAITPDVHVGLGISAPFGLSTEYNDSWMGRFQAVRSEIKTVNINPSVSLKVNDQLSLGLGVSAMRTSATLTRAVNFGGGGEGYATIKGDDWGFGFNLGGIFQATPDTRIGFAYRSRIDQKLEGDVEFRRPALVPPGAAPDGDIYANVTLPENVALSLFHKLNDKWDLMGDVTWTRWSRLKELRIMRESGTLLSLTPENWENTLRYSLGANYRYSDKLKLRAGVAYDQEAIRDEYRTARIPGNDRTWLSLGAQYKVSSSGVVDLGYTHLFLKDASINAVDSAAVAANGRIKGEYEGSVDILSVQYTHNF